MDFGSKRIDLSMQLICAFDFAYQKPGFLMTQLVSHRQVFVSLTYTSHAPEYHLNG